VTSRRLPSENGTQKTSELGGKICEEHADVALDVAVEACRRRPPNLSSPRRLIPMAKKASKRSSKKRSTKKRAAKRATKRATKKRASKKRATKRGA